MVIFDSCRIYCENRSMVTSEEEAVEREIRKVLRGRGQSLRGHRFILFGSRGRGTEDRRSDFDVGVDGEQPLDLKEFFELESLFEQMDTLYSVDWVDLNRASAKLLENARREGRVIYEA